MTYYYIIHLLKTSTKGTKGEFYYSNLDILKVWVSYIFHLSVISGFTTYFSDGLPPVLIMFNWR